MRERYTNPCFLKGANRHAMDNISIVSVLCSVGIFATTIQAQDFKDVEGDKLVGRKTLPIVAPNVARPTLMLALAAWSIGLSALWQLSVGATLVFNFLSLSVGVRYMLFEGVKADQRSFYLYNVNIKFDLFYFIHADIRALYWY